LCGHDGRVFTTTQERVEKIMDTIDAYIEGRRDGAISLIKGLHDLITIKDYSQTISVTAIDPLTEMQLHEIIDVILKGRRTHELY